MTDRFIPFILLCLATGALIGGIAGLAARVTGWVP